MGNSSIRNVSILLSYNFDGVYALVDLHNVVENYTLNIKF